jgi:hypothetical protein
LKGWREKVCYVVGDASCDRVRGQLLWPVDRVLGQETGNAKNLSAKIVDDLRGQVS